MARVVIPNIPHHVTQRGNRRQPVFFRDEDRPLYRSILRTQAERFGLSIWAYCLMTNHIHLIAVPRSEESLAHAIGESHRRYTSIINKREGWQGYLWQGRFGSVPLDESHLYAAVRYVEANPLRAGLVAKAEDYPWSSANAHVLRNPDSLLSGSFLQEEIHDWREFLASAIPEDRVRAIRLHTRTGRPLGTPQFLQRCERVVKRPLQKHTPGPHPHN